MTPPEPSESRAVTALTDLVRSSVKPPSAAELQRGLVALRTRLAVVPSHPRATLRWALVVTSVVLCVALGLVGVLEYRSDSAASPRPIALNRIEGGKLLDGGYLSESGKAGIKLSFNEGSEFWLRPGARGRLRELAPDGAHFSVEHGTASFRITKDPTRRWSVEAGPFLVTVKGTDFSVSWDAASESFELRLRRGRVTVSGPVVGEDFALSAGQKLAVSLPKAETLITEEREAAVEPFEPAAAPSVSASTSSTPETAPPSSVSATASPRVAPSAAVEPKSTTERGFREALARGQWDHILAQVERDGLDATLDSATSDDLLALADAARYRRRVDLARAALLAHRRRFPSSPRSLDALFLLGRVEELRASGSAPAIRWYDEYLARAPAGTYAAEALGRKMILTNQTTGPANARRIAEEYLRRFPAGSHAGAARALRDAR